MQLTVEAQQQVGALLTASMQHYRDLLAAGKRELSTTQYDDSWQGLVAIETDPRSAASQFSAWRVQSRLEQDMSFLFAYKQARAFYNGIAEPKALISWCSSMSLVHADLLKWVSVAAAWQVRLCTTKELDAAEAVVRTSLQWAEDHATEVMAS